MRTVRHKSRGTVAIRMLVLHAVSANSKIKL